MSKGISMRQRSPSKALVGLPYYGGKSPRNRLGHWISSVIGFDCQETYVEPFAGMLGVLLSRPPCRIELVNDLNGDLTNWWIHARDHSDDMARKIFYTPRSREIYSKAQETLKGNSVSKLERAVAFHTVCSQSIINAPARLNASWGHSYNSHVGSRWSGEEFYALARRLSRVQIENLEAVKILERTGEEKKTLIYCDPPYLTADNSPYGPYSFDKDALRELLKSQQGRVAVSGYGNEWDELDWNRFEFRTIFKGVIVSKAEERTEVLWTNFESREEQLNLF